MRPIHGQNSVQVVDFVLEELSPIALEIDLVKFALEVLVTDPNPIRSVDPDQQIRERKTVIPDRKVFGADVDDLGVDQRPRAVHFDVDDPDWSADLGRRNAAAGSEAGLPIPEGIPKVVHDHSDGRGAGLGNWLTSGPKDRVSKESNSMDSHVT